MNTPTAPRSVIWQDIWQRKASQSTAALHHVNGYDLLDDQAWHGMIEELSTMFPLRPHAAVAELGCGAGAFLATLRHLAPTIKIAGIDYAAGLVELARQRLEGQFWVADVRACPQLATASFDVACSFGTTMYLDAEADVTAMLGEMRRITRPGGRIYVGEISDLARRELALSLRPTTHAANQRVSNASPDHLYLPKEFFLAYAAQHRLTAEIRDHLTFNFGRSNPLAVYRYSVCLQLPAAA